MNNPAPTSMPASNPAKKFFDFIFFTNLLNHNFLNIQFIFVEGINCTEKFVIVQ